MDPQSREDWTARTA